MKPIVWLCFEAHAHDGYVWAIRVGNTWFKAKRVTASVPFETVYRGRGAKQPKAYLRGRGDVYVTLGGHATIH